MLNPVGKENQINFMNINYDSLAKEVKDINESRNHKSKKEVPLKKASSGNIYTQKSQNMIPFIDGNSVPEPTKKESSNIIAEPAKRLNNKLEENKSLTDKSVFSATCGDIRDDGGSSSKVGLKKSNSIWDNNILQDMMNKADSKEVTSQLKQDLKERRESMQNERMDEMVNQLQDTDTRKASGVSPLDSLSGSSYRKSQNSISIFDNMEFANLPDKTSGEKISEKRTIEKMEKDESWRNNKGSISSSDVLNRLFDSLSQDSGE